MNLNRTKFKVMMSEIVFIFALKSEVDCLWVDAVLTEKFTVNNFLCI